MQRDYEVIRHILLAVEKSSETLIRMQHLVNDQHDKKTVSYHIELLVDANFIEVIVRRPRGRMCGLYDVKRITSSGHDFLDGMKNENIWGKVKKKFASVGESVPLELAKIIMSEVAKDVAKSI